MQDHDAAAMKDRKTTLSTLWIFATVNYIYADVFTVFDLLADPVAAKKFGTGYAGSFHVTHASLLAAAVLMETAFLMIPLARLLSYRPNRWANIIVGIIHTLAVLLSLFVEGVPTRFTYYTLFATVEIACTLGIIGYAWKWRKFGSKVTPVTAGRSLVGQDEALGRG